MQRLQQLLQVGAAGADPARRRGSAWQQPRRQLEQEVRPEAVAFRPWLAALGLGRSARAAWLGITPRTIRLWEGRGPSAGGVVPALGRPVQRSERAQRTAVLALRESVGPGVGLAVLQGHFPDLPRAALHDLLRRNRRVWVARHRQVVHVLHWQRPGAVWAIDYAEPPQPLAEGFTDLLAVRDLASGMQLWWLPVAEATAAATGAAWQALFALYGPPLVLKLDNGSPFVAALTPELLAAWPVVPLYSPPGLPAYHGAIEAGIGALKARTHYQAARQGRPGAWTCADVEAARHQANELGRPWGARGLTPAETWARRPPLTADERQAFRVTVQRLAEAARAPAPSPSAAAACPLPGAAASPDPAAPAAEEPIRDASEAAPAGSLRRAAPADATTLPSSRASQPPAAAERPTDLGRPPDAAAGGGDAPQQREAISCALVAHGYLLFTRRRIPLPIKRKKVA